MPAESLSDLIAGADLTRGLDALFINAPLRDYSVRARANDFTLPVLGMGYVATYAAARGFNIGVLDAEAHGLGIARTVQVINDVAPRWAGFNLLAPTYEISARIANSLAPDIKIMLGGHHQLHCVGVTAFRFVDDLFLGARRIIEQMMAGFTTEQVGEWAPDGSTSSTALATRP
jgi:hypothetical protein